MKTMRGLRSILEKETDIEVVGEADDGREAVRLGAGIVTGYRADGYHDAQPQRHRSDPTDRKRQRLESDRRCRSISVAPSSSKCWRRA